MKIESILLVAVPVISVLSLIFIPKKKVFQAQFVFLFVGMPTWILGLSAVQLGLIEYPYREPIAANRTSFIFEYLVLPIMCLHFNVHYPKRSSKSLIIGYYLGITLVFTVIEYFAERYTMILKYTGWKPYYTFIGICFIFWLSRKCMQWFFKSDNKRIWVK